MPFNVVALADAIPNVAKNVAALANTDAAKHVRVCIRVCPKRDIIVVSELRECVRRGYISVGRIIIVVNGLIGANEPFVRD